MPILPARLSPRWLLVFVITAAALIAGLLWVGAENSGRPPTPETALPVVGIAAGIAGVLSLLGALGARATFACATLGLLIGLAQMIHVALTAHEGMADLAALASFMLFGAIGLALGAVLDLVRAVRTRRP